MRKKGGKEENNDKKRGEVNNNEEKRGKGENNKEKLGGKERIGRNSVEHPKIHKRLGFRLKMGGGGGKCRTNFHHFI